MKNLENCIKSICNIVVEICNEEIISYNLHFQIVICFYSPSLYFFWIVVKMLFSPANLNFLPCIFFLSSLELNFSKSILFFFLFSIFQFTTRTNTFFFSFKYEKRKREVLCWTILLYNNSSVWFSFFFSIPELILMTKKEEENLSFINEKFYRVYALPLDLIEVFFLSLFLFFPFTN